MSKNVHFTPFLQTGMCSSLLRKDEVRQKLLPYIVSRAFSVWFKSIIFKQEQGWESDEIQGETQIKSETKAAERLGYAGGIPLVLTFSMPFSMPWRPVIDMTCAYIFLNCPLPLRPIRESIFPFTIFMHGNTFGTWCYFPYFPVPVHSLDGVLPSKHHTWLSLLPPPTTTWRWFQVPNYTACI